MKYWEVYAKSGNYNSTKELAILDDVIGNFYKDGEVVMSFESTKGSYKEDTKQITLYGDSYVVADDGTSIKADKIVWSGAEEDIIATGDVHVLRKDELTTISDKAIFNNDFTKFKILGNTKTHLFKN